MRKYLINISCCIILLVLSVPIYADDDCDQTLREAKTAYNAGEYTKAKKLYDYVVSICGSSYGNAASLSQKCQDALTPKLSVSRSSISVSAYSGTTSITVTSNRTWKLANTNSSLFTVSRNGDNISISYSANPNTSSRSDYFDVVTTDGSKSVRVYVYQEAKANTTPYLSVNKTSIYASASGTTEYITVSSNTTWDIQYPSATMYSVTRNGNTLTVKINANTSTESRTDYFNVKTTDGTKVQKISLSQSGKSSSSSSSYGSYATINNITVDHNVYQNGSKGMKIHVKFDAYSVYNHTLKVCVFFSYAGGSDLNGIVGSNYVTSDGKATVQSSATANYTNTTWNDYTLFMPYTNLNMQAGCKNVSLEGQVGVYDVTDHKWLTSNFKKFTFTFSN